MIPAIQTIEDNIISNKYDPAVDYPSMRDPERNQKVKLYAEQTEKGKTLFKNDLLEAFNLQNHPKGELAFNIAWEDGHARGHFEVLCTFSKLSTLLV